MNYRDLRFFGHYIHEVSGNERAQAMIKQEMDARKPDAQTPGGYAPDDNFKKEASRFGDNYRAMRDDMLNRARNGSPVSRDEYVTLVRAERINIEANSTSGLAKHRLSLLEAGKNPFGPNGMSDSRMLGKLTGFDKDNGPGDRLIIGFDPRPGR